jgi:uncharacterized membrane protein (DUF485 family)
VADESVEKRRAEARKRLVRSLPRLAGSVVIFYAAFVGILAGFGHRHLEAALVDALVVTAGFIVVVSLFVGGILLLAVKTAPRR